MSLSDVVLFLMCLYVSILIVSALAIDYNTFLSNSKYYQVLALAVPLPRVVNTSRAIEYARAARQYSSLWKWKFPRSRFWLPIRMRSAMGRVSGSGLSLTSRSCSWYNKGAQAGISGSLHANKQTLLCIKSILSSERELKSSGGSQETKYGTVKLNKTPTRQQHKTPSSSS